MCQSITGQKQALQYLKAIVIFATILRRILSMQKGKIFTKVNLTSNLTSQIKKKTEAVV